MSIANDHLTYTISISRRKSICVCTKIIRLKIIYSLSKDRCNAMYLEKTHTHTHVEYYVNGGRIRSPYKTIN